MDASKSHRAGLWLALILIVAAALRLYGLDWDQGQHAHPDERWIAMVAPTIEWPRRLGDLLDPRRSTLNPLWVPDGQGGGSVRNFAYGHLPLYLQAFAGQALARLGAEMRGWGDRYQEIANDLMIYGSYGGISYVGRALSALADLGTIYLVFLLGWRIYGERVGLLGAALTAVAVMHIQLSHFSTFDVITTFFIILSVYGSVCVVQARERSMWPTLWAGVAAGLAVASKFSAAPLVAVLVMAQVLRGGWMAGTRERHDPGQMLRRSFSRSTWLHIMVSLVAALAAFFVTSPFAILDLRLYLKQILEQGAMVRGQADWPFTRQYIHTTPFVYQIVQQVRWGLGWPLGIAAFAGFGWATVRQFRYLLSSHRQGGAYEQGLVREQRAGELVMLGWAIPYFLLTGSFMVKFMRYMLPLLPLFILMGAAMLWQVRDASRASKASGGNLGARSILLRGTRRIARVVGQALPWLVLLASALYALAFMRVYTQTHPWIQASRWIYAHLPDGAAIAREHWDDDLPLSLPEERANPGAHQYDMRDALKLPMYEVDNRAKYEQIRSILSEADYVVFATNRLYRTIPRLPERYPMSTEFYRLFFAEKLGYVRASEFTAYPGLLGLRIVDDDADESFTVYDHPKPIIFRKARDLSDAEWDALFADVLAKQPVLNREKFDLLALFNRKQAAEPPEDGQKRTLLLDRPVGDLPVVADFGWNRWASASTVGAVALWWLVVAALGLLAWPVTFVLFSGLRDRGYLLSRAVALLVVGYLVWLPTSLHWLKNGLPLTYAAIGALLLVSALLLRRYRQEIAAFWHAKGRLLLIEEAIWGLSFLFFVGIRILNPDLWQPWLGGEKSMDIAYLNACLRSAYFPPLDPYFADGYLNYYYYGQFLLSIVTRLTGIRATVAFNLAVPLLFAMTVGHAFSIGYTLADKMSTGRRGGALDDGKKIGFGIGHGLFAALCVTVLGNLASATQVIGTLGRLSPSTFTSRLPGVEALVRAASGAWQILAHGATFPGFNYWDPSRVVGLTINEFPYWSFLFADLHPHLMNIPFTLMVIALALNWLCRRPAVRPADSAVRGDLPSSELALIRSSARVLWQRLDWGEVLTWVFWPIALGVLGPINTWDWPAYAGFSGLALLFVWTRARGRQGVLPALLASVALAGGSLLLYAPFFKYYTALYVGLGWSLGRTHTDLGQFLTVWGFFLFVSITLLLALLGVQRSRWALVRVLRILLRHLTRLPRVDELYAMLVREVKMGLRLAAWAAVLLFALAVWWAWRGYWVLALMVPLLALSTTLLVQPRLPEGRRFVLALISTAFLLLVGVELFYLRDHLDGDQAGWWRMNTLFKFYLQVWIMLGVAVGVSLPEIWRLVTRWPAGWRGVWKTALALLLVAASLYVPLGTPARVMDRFPGERPAIGTLDGMAFMTVGVYTWPNENNPIHLWGDYEAIRWLQENVRGTPVLAEAPIGYYREFGVRVASYTGLPTLLGMHESEQRYNNQIDRRGILARDLFSTADLDRTMDVTRELRVEYVYIGPLERVEYPNASAKFQQLELRGELAIVYQNELVTILRVAK
jgi:YYY domain-containing protein